MTKSRGIGRGGKRHGAGRKRKVFRSAQFGADREKFTGTASDLKQSALMALETIMQTSRSAMLRVRAAKIILAEAAREGERLNGRPSR